MEEQLSSFGNLFIESVRDNTLFVLEGIISGHMKSKVYKEMYEKINRMSEQDRELLMDFAYRMVDLSLHNMLFMFEASKEWIISDSENTINIAEDSDGLSGELYTDDGWIHRFSNYKRSNGL